MAWCCLGCNIIISDTLGKVRGRYYCSHEGFMCEGEKLMKKKNQAKCYKINKLAKAIMKQGGLQNYKYPSNI